MPIIYEKKYERYHIQGKSFSMVLSAFLMGDGSRVLLMRYFGPPLSVIPTEDDELLAERFRSFDTANAVLPFAVPTAGHGDFRPVQFEFMDQAGQNCTRLSLCGHEVRTGKTALAGLPATYVEEEKEATTLELELKDVKSGASVQVSYTLFEELDALAVSSEIVNEGDGELILEQAGSVSLDLPEAVDFVHLHGAWAREFQIEKAGPMHGERTIRSMRGATGHQHNPFVALAVPGATEQSGAVYGISLVYSGNFQITADQDAYDHTRVTAGLNPQTFRWKLAPGEHFQTPEAVLAYSNRGYAHISHVYHELYKKRLCRGRYRDMCRPILVNNWEATYFNFTKEKLLEIAGTAADLGVELFVLDDGWFGRREDDSSSLGDWFVNNEKLAEGLRQVSDEIHNLGLAFGLWFEPEMISEKSLLYENHPDWVFRARGYEITPSRNQYILDLSRVEVQDYVIESVDRILEDNRIDYVKWDMNRNFAEIGSASGIPSGELSHRYMLGVYRVMETITSRHPDILFEGCSGGGGRFDPGMLFYMPQIWTSDNSDAVSRLKIQYGASMVYPPSVMCSHVSAVPNHQVKRVTGLEVRGHVAMSGVFGYQLDFNQCTKEEREQIIKQIEMAKQYREIVRCGTFNRLISPFSTNDCAWQFQTEDELLVFAFRILQSANVMPPRICLTELPSNVVWQGEDGRLYDSRYLMYHGLATQLSNPIEGERGDFQSQVFHLKKVHRAE